MEFRRPRPDTPILPQSAIFRREPVKPFKRPKGRRGKKPRGAKLKPRNLSQFSKFHTEAARNKERDRAEQERIDKIKERDDARRERTDRLQIEDRRYAAKVITDARERAAERGFRAEQLRLLRQQAAAPPPALPPPPAAPVINIAPAPVNIAPPQIDVRPVINIPPPQQAPAPPRQEPPPARVGVAAYQQPRGGVEMTPEEQQEARNRIYAGLVGQPQPDAIPRWAAAQLEQERQRREQAEAGLDAERQNRLAITDRARREIESEQGLRGQAERDREAAARAVEEATREAAEVRQRELDALRVAAETQRQAEGLQTQLSALERREADRLARGEEERGTAEQELTEQVARAQRLRNRERDRADELDRQRLAAEERAAGLQTRAAELEAQNQTLQDQRRPAVIAPLRDGSQFETQEDRDDEIAERFSDQYRELILKQSSSQQRRDPEFLQRLSEFQDRVEQDYRLPFQREGEDVPDADIPFYINPFRPENEEFLRRELAQERVLRGVGAREGQTFTPELVEQELETIRRLERENQRRRLGRGQPTPPEIRFEAGELTESEVRRDLPFEGIENPFELVRQGSSGLSRGSSARSAAEEAIESRIEEIEEEQRLDLGGLDFTPPTSIPTSDPLQLPRGFARQEGVAPLDPAIEVARERNRQITERAQAQQIASQVRSILTPRPSAAAVEEVDSSIEQVDRSVETPAVDTSLEAALSPTSSLESLEDPFDKIRDDYDAGKGTNLAGGIASGRKLKEGQTHFVFRDETGWIGKGRTAGKFKGKDVVLLNAQPNKGQLLVRTKDSIGNRDAPTTGSEGVEANIKFDMFEGLRQQGEINLIPHDHLLQPLQPPQQVRLDIQEEEGGGLAEAVGGAVATAGGVIGNAALGAARGVGGAVYDRLPSAGDVGEAVGRGVVAGASGVAGVVRGGIRAATSPRQPAIGEQTGGVARGLVEDVSSEDE